MNILINVLSLLTKYTVKYKASLILSSLVFSPLLQAQPTPLSDYYQNHFTTRDGLPQNTINDIAQTADGYLWFATWNGLARFNGREFRLYSRDEQAGFPGSAIRVLMNDGPDLLAVEARGGLSRYQDPAWISQPSVNVIINDVLRDQDGLVWLATLGDGIYVRNGNNTLAHFDKSHGLPSQDVYSLVQDSAGRIWVGTAKGLVWIANNTVHAVDAIADIPVSALLLDRQNRLLIGSEQGLYAAEQTEVSRIYPELAKKSIISLLQDNNNDLWLGTATQGLLRISALGIEQLEVNRGFPAQRVLSLFQDKEQSIWVGTNTGLMSLRQVPFNSLTEQHGLNGNYVRAVLAHSDGSVWVGGSAGLTHIKNGEVSALSLTMADGVSPSVLSLVEGLTGELLLGTYTHGLQRLEQDQLVAVSDRSQGLVSNEVRSLIVSPDGSIWVGTNAGLNQLKAEEVKTYTREMGLPDDFIMGLHQVSNGDLWVATGAGAAIIRDEKITPVYLNGQGAEYAFGFYSEPKGDYVWIGTDRGLVRYRYADATLSLIDANHGLPVEKIFQPIADQLGGLWLPTSNGVTRINLAAAHRVADGLQDTLDVEHFDESDGLVSAQANGGTGPLATLLADGSVWMATAMGVARMDAARLAEFSYANLPVVFEKLTVADTEVSLNSPIVLAPDSGRIRFHFAGLGFAMSERIRYRTLLQGFDQNWSLSSQQNTAEYTNLPPGDYVLHVTAAYPYQNWHEQKASLGFTVLPFIWQRPVFWLFIAFLVLVSGWWLMGFRLRLLAARATKLEQQVSDKTQELQLQAVELQRQAQAFKLLAKVDVLTRLPNRRAFDKALSQAFNRAKRSELPITLVVIDIDHFKHVNDTWSHGVGDQVIKIVADIIRREIREVDIPARWGGEEFTVLLADTEINDALPICERVRLAVKNHDYSQIDAKFTLTISLGVAQTSIGIDEHKLLANADQALYRAKHYGRNQVVVFTEIES